VAGVRSRDGRAGDGDRAAVGLVGAGDDLDQRALAGAVLAEQGVDLAGLKIESTPERAGAAVVLCELAEFEERNETWRGREREGDGDRKCAAQRKTRREMQDCQMSAALVGGRRWFCVGSRGSDTSPVRPKVVTLKPPDCLRQRRAGISSFHRLRAPVAKNQYTHATARGGCTLRFQFQNSSLLWPTPLYSFAQETYAALGVDTEAALRRLAGVPISLHCWQGDDVGGSRKPATILPAAALRPRAIIRASTAPSMNCAQGIEVRLPPDPGRHRLNLHACYTATRWQGGRPRCDHRRAVPELDRRTAQDSISTPHASPTRRRLMASRCRMPMPASANSGSITASPAARSVPRSAASWARRRLPTSGFRTATRICRLIVARPRAPHCRARRGVRRSHRSAASPRCGRGNSSALARNPT